MSTLLLRGFEHGARTRSFIVEAGLQADAGLGRR